ncbi:MAG: type IV pilin protein [Zoogloeaceae bacterium]|jgi:hypothetical protein|nr:type IV pilin protein [Zoogloeaceae bacterium]
MTRIDSPAIPPMSAPPVRKTGPTTHKLSIGGVTSSAWALTAVLVGAQAVDRCGALSINNFGQKYAIGLPPQTIPNFTQEPGSCW